ncbi:MAG: hypothetical protein QXG22_01505 [Candidatus Hadarchaeales archaeon]
MKGREARDLTLSAFVLALAFSTVFAGGPGKATNYLPLSLLAVSVGFVAHELSHRYLARRFGCYAEYRAWPMGLLLALLLSLVGFVFAAPGAVVIQPRLGPWGTILGPGKREYGKISLAGPLSNLFLASLFLSLHLLHPWFGFYLAASVNGWLALFNLLPLPPLDGSKVFRWDKRVWAGAFLISLFFLFA